MSRYDRQTMLPEIGPEGQEKLGRARVLCIGAGGLGCAVLPYLAGAGVGHITIIDDDVIEASNLHRQVLFGDDDQGRAKAEMAALRLKEINPEIGTHAIVDRLNAGNAQRLFEDHDVVVEGSDNFDTKFLAGDAAVKFGVPLVYGSAVGFEAQVTVLDSDRGPCLRCLYRSPPSGWVPNCAENGVLGPLVGAAGCVQASEVIKLIVAEGRKVPLEHLIGRLWMIDGYDMQSHSLRFERRPDCPCCSREPADICLPRPERDPSLGISVDEAKQLENAIFIDVRSHEDWKRGHIPGARHLPLPALMDGATPVIENGETCVVYCERGNRGQIAARLIHDATGQDVRNLRGGLAAWPDPPGE